MLLGGPLPSFAPFVWCRLLCTRLYRLFCLLCCFVGHWDLFNVFVKRHLLLLLCWPNLRYEVMCSYYVCAVFFAHFQLSQPSTVCLWCTQLLCTWADGFSGGWYVKHERR